MNQKLPELTIFFPFWNEEKNVTHVVENAIPIASQVAEKWEIIIVDDGSSDKTLELGRQLEKKHAHVRVITHSPNRGYGAALKEGFENAKYEYVVFTDGDRQFDFVEFKDIDGDKKYPDFIGINHYNGLDIIEIKTHLKNAVTWDSSHKNFSFSSVCLSRAKVSSPPTFGGSARCFLPILHWPFHILRIFLHLSPRHFPLPLPHFCSHRSSLGSSRSHSAQSISVSQHGRNSSNCTSSTKSYSSQVWNLNQHRSLFRPQKSRWVAQSHRSHVA
jgi:glycosyltransferase involved in cell wall biosynthesis